MSIVKFRNSALRPVVPSFLDDFFLSDLFPATDSSRMMSLPATNIEETEKEFLLDMAVPGLKKEDINVEVNGDSLRVYAEKETSSEEEEKNYSRKEYSFNSFERSFTLPDNVTGAVSAKYKDGVLQISLPKKEVTVSKAKRIKVA